MATSAPSTSTASAKKAHSSVGAPSQRTQSSRKGKKAWRKNVDLDEVEESLEQLRSEERVIGIPLQKTTNDELFQIDVKGDEAVRKRLPKFSSASLTSAKILAQRSAVPAVFSRPQASSSLKRKLTHEEKGRLLRIGKKLRKGPFNALIDPTEVGAGSALLEVSEAVKNSGGYDVWTSEGEEAEPEEVEKKASVRSAKVKQPNTPNPRAHIAVSAVPAPHEGTSYNPPVNSHLTLLRSAHEAEEKRVKDAEQLKGLKDKIIEARRVAEELNNGDSVPGMQVDIPKADTVDEYDEEGDEERPVKKAPERKTKKERLKAAKRRAEKRALAEKLAQKRLLNSVALAKSMRKSLAKTIAQREKELRERHVKTEEEKLKRGLAGKRLGKHIVPEGDIDVQLGEDLSESFRGLKPEGNLFRDRFLNMQHRALIEPRARVIPKKGKAKIKEYEKHAYKRFDRESQ